MLILIIEMNLHLYFYVTSIDEAVRLQKNLAGETGPRTEFIGRFSF